MKRTYQSIITLILCAGLTACLTTEEDDMSDIQPFPEGPWGSTYSSPPPPPKPAPTPQPQPEWVAEVEEAPAPVSPPGEKKYGWFGKKKSTEAETGGSASEKATAVPVPVEEFDVEIEIEEITPPPTPAAATHVSEPEKGKRFSFFGRNKEPEAESAPKPDRETVAKTSPGAPTPSISFVDDIKPIFQHKCVGCHNRDTLHGRVSLESRQLAFQGGPAGAFIVPGNPEGSVLLQNVVTSKTKENAMPPVGHRVTRKEKDLLYAWIMEGAQWPDGPSGRITPDVLARE